MMKAKRVVKKKNPNGRPCSICAHKEIKSINQMILQPQNFRAISRFMVGSDVKRDSLRRHTENCLQLEIAALIERKKIENVVDAFSELCEQLEFAKALRQASKDFLSDSEGKVTLIPRAEEIDVLYRVKVLGKSVKLVAPLDELLQRLEDEGVIAPRPIIKTGDIRRFALDTINTTDSIVDKFIKIEGLYSKERDNPDDLRNTIEAIKFFLEKHPEADREEVIAAYAIPKGFSTDQIIQELGGVQ